MKTNNFLRVTLLATSLSIFFACKKDNSQSASSTTTSATSVQSAADDQTMVSNENDAVSNDVTAALNGNPAVSGSSMSRMATTGVNTLGSGILGFTICDASITYDTTSTTKTITIVYNGLNCHGNRTRTGTVIISVPKDQHWKDAGAVVNVQIQALKITRNKDGKSILINGSKTITNTSGGLLVDLASLQTITHDFQDSLTVTFNNGSSRNWQTSVRRAFTYNDGIVVTTTGTHSDGTHNNIASWGTNRFGVNFTNMITSPRVVEQSCDMRLVSGQDSIVRSDNITSVITYGLDSNGNPVTSCPSSYFYAKLVWTNGNNGKVYTYIYPY
ncbi:MAG: hypothetical protein JST58_18985 [Bacteroidetes bacterium]|nr:hypothetical protein [Bacteroidota bacterium]